MLPGRVFNGVERVPVEWRIAGWTIGPLSFVFPALAIALFALGANITVWVGVLFALIPALLWVIYVPLSNRVNPELRLRELTMIQLVVSGLRHRRSDTRIDYGT